MYWNELKRKEIDIMGFKKGSKTGAPNRKGHRWINYPNNAHKKCTKCGCMVDITCSKGVNVSIYTVTRKDWMKAWRLF